MSHSELDFRQDAITIFSGALRNALPPQLREDLSVWRAAFIGPGLKRGWHLGVGKGNVLRMLMALVQELSRTDASRVLQVLIVCCSEKRVSCGDLMSREEVEQLCAMARSIRPDADFPSTFLLQFPSKEQVDKMLGLRLRDLLTVSIVLDYAVSGSSRPIEDTARRMGRHSTVIGKSVDAVESALEANLLERAGAHASKRTRGATSKGLLMMPILSGLLGYGVQLAPKDQAPTDVESR